MSEGLPADRSDVKTAAPFLLIAALCAGFAFVGLSASSYWMDELFSLFVIDHHGGWDEVLRRALTDTHPPAYYFIAYEWVRLFGVSEAATRSLSAIFAVLSLPVLYFALRPRFSLPATAFALALAAGSGAFFEQAQNTRAYSLCILISSGLLWITLAAHRRLAQAGRAPAGLLAGLFALGLFGAFTHFYLFLAVGMLHLFLLLSAQRWRDRGLLVASGLVIAALMSIYAAALMHSSQQDLHDMWFSNKLGTLLREALGGVFKAWGEFGIAALALLLLAPWIDRRRLAAGRPAPPPPATERAPLQLFLLVVIGTIVAGLAVSFTVAPSFGKRNLLVLAPFLWGIAAWMYDAIGPDPRRLPSRILIGALIALTAADAAAVATRPLQRNEDWRGSAAYVNADRGCAGKPIPVILPYIFGPSTPFFRELARRYFFGRYADPQRLIPYIPAEVAPQTADPALRELLRGRVADGRCRILLWAVHDVKAADLPDLQRALAETAGVSPDRVDVRSFKRRKVALLGTSKGRQSAFVFELEPSAPDSGPR